MGLSFQKWGKQPYQLYAIQLRRKIKLQLTKVNSNANTDEASGVLAAALLSTDTGAGAATGWKTMRMMS